MTARELIEAILAKGWTQQQIAERVGIHQPTVSKIVCGTVLDIRSKTYLVLLALYEEVVVAQPTT